MRAPVCETCPAPVVRKPGSRGPLPRRCEACRAPKPSSAKPKPKQQPALPARGFTGIALSAELAEMPPAVQASTEAAIARELACQIDQGLSMTSASKELTRVLALLRNMASEQAPAATPKASSAAREVPTGVADLASRALARRRSAAG